MTEEHQDHVTHREGLTQYFDSVASESVNWQNRYRYYRETVVDSLRFVIPPGASVLEVGCGAGDLLNALEPARGVGVDVSPKMIETARERFPHLEFQVDDVEDLQIEETFDYVVLFDLVGHLYDVQSAFANLRRVCHRKTRVVVFYFNYLWSPLLKLAESVGLRMKRPPLNWLPVDDIGGLLHLNGFETIKRDYNVLLPVYIPLVSTVANRYLANLPLLWKLSVNSMVVARCLEPEPEPDRFSCSVVVPCRNESGNIQSAVDRIPAMGRHTEILFVEGGSSDDTLAQCHRVQALGTRDIKVLEQDGKGKADAVRKGFEAASGDILMILDADLTVAPEDLPKFFRALSTGVGEFINGSRLVYPMDAGAMRPLNLAGNKFFSKAFSYLLEQRLRDTLCGTKVLFRHDYERIAAGRSYFGDFDPFGDFDLLFGATKLNLKIVEIPIRYRSRTYGDTNISRFSHGWLLLKMVLWATHKLKFL